MIMNTRMNNVLVVAFCLLAMLARPHAGFAQATPVPIVGSWEAIKAIPPGDEVRVRLRNGRTLMGRLINVSDTALTIELGKKTMDVTRADTLRVHRVITKSAKKATLIGLGIGAGIGGVGGGGLAAAAGAQQPRDYAIVAGFLAAIGAGVGALTGYLVGSRKHRELIYETR